MLDVATWVLLRPASLAKYSAASAAASRSVTSPPTASRAATPIEMVSRTYAAPSWTGMDNAATWARNRSAMLSASASSVWGSRTTNSSPPNLPTTSYSRSWSRSTSLTARSTESPAR